MSAYSSAKKILQSFIQGLIFSDIYITLGAIGFAIVNFNLLKIDVYTHAILLVVIGAATMFIYQFSRWTFFKDLQNTMTKDLLYYWMNDHKGLVKMLLLFSVVCGLVSLFFIRWETIITLVALGVISVLYNISIPLGNGKSFTFRRIPFAKICMIAIVWASMAVLLPWVEVNGWMWNIYVNQLFWIQFLFIFIITLPFDINDMVVDEADGLRTIPIYLGTINSKILLIVLSFLYIIFLTEWVTNIYHNDLQKVVFLIGISALVLSLLYKTLRWSYRANKWQIMLWYDGSLILYFLIYSASELLTI
ncbi:MAG TPA: UbiA family prenyltransferase [Chitinophagales bacterium]|nr:UbiA family prenyltransferase [Chitinophagales bacterium]